MAKWNRLGAALIDLWFGYAVLEVFIFIILLIPGGARLFMLGGQSILVDLLTIIIYLLLAIFSLAISNTLMTYFFSNTFGKFILHVNVVFTDDVPKKNKHIKGQKRKTIKRQKKNNIQQPVYSNTKRTRKDRNFIKIFKREWLKYYYFVCTITLYGIYCIILILRGKFVLPHDKKSHTKVG